MHDLRKQALLESGKTVSRKARSKTASPMTSRPASRANSRPAASRTNSRNVSDDEGELSDTTQWSTHSIDELIAEAADSDLPQEAWIDDLNERIHDILDRKRSSVQGREETLQGFNLDLTRHYAMEELKPRMEELLPAVLKSVKGGATERETVLALKGLALMLITVPSESVYDTISDPIKSTISDAVHPHAKLAAIHALSIVTFYGGASVEETEAILDFLLEIISSDGASVNEEDHADIVEAALQEWGFLATQLEDVEDITEPAMEAFVEQLESSDVGVQIAAGDNIALLYEKSYTEVEEDEVVAEEEVESNGSDEHMVKRYTVYRQQHQLEQLLEDLAKASSKRVSKKDRKALHLTFSDILNTVEKPTRGPRYSTALDKDNSAELGSRLKIRVHDGGRLTIDKWWMWHRMNGLKRLLQGGFLVHFERNEVVSDSLPGDVERDDYK